MSLDLLRSFANTLDVEQDDDELADAARTGEWLVEHELLEPPAPTLSRAEVDLVLATRDGIRDLIVATHSPEVVPARPHGLEQVVEAAGLRPVFAPTGTTVAPTAGGVAGAMGRLLAHVHDAMVDGSWARLKLCANDSCRWAFHDQSRNRSGRWCDMAVCGNRAKVRAYRERIDP